jgi:hypothetical protein
MADEQKLRDLGAVRVPIDDPEFIALMEKAAEESRTRRLNEGLVSVWAFFDGGPGDDRDNLCQRTIKRHGGKFCGAGTHLQTSRRDVDFEIPYVKLAACIAALNAAGFETNVAESEH